MYHFVEDKVFLGRMRDLCSNIVNQLVQKINNEGRIKVLAHLVGSGAKNLVTQNANESIDLDYNLCINNSFEYDINSCRDIKEYIRKSFNEILERNGWADCEDSTSALTTEKRHFLKGNATEFSIDLAIVVKIKGTWYRLIHNKTGFTFLDTYNWNETPNSKGFSKKVNWLKSNNLWEEVRDAYLNKKNMYLSRCDYNHHSFNCYIEAVNEIYSKYE